MLIRKATIEDSYQIAQYLLMAMEDIVYEFIKKKDYNEAFNFLYHFVKLKNNQYSYQNCVVAEDDGEIIAAVNIYDGAKLEELRSPIIAYLQENFGLDYMPESETESGEYYIDTIAVSPRFRRKNIGTKLLQYLINKYVINQKLTLGLLVEEDNLVAKNLYLKLGFKKVAEKSLVGNILNHLQIKG